MPKTSIALKDLVRLDRQLQRDQDRPLRQLQERDRAIGAPLQKASPRKKLRAWLDANSDSGDARKLGGMEVSIGFWLALLGLSAGIVTVSGLLLVEQRQPVNVLLFLTVLVGLQWLLLILTLLVSLAVALHGQIHLPLENLNPARWLFRRTFNRFAGDIRHEQFSPATRLLLMTWGQLFGVLFNVGAMAALLVILLVMDRSFGWSSTLDISAAALHRSLQWLAQPWSDWLPEATVDADLVAATRYRSLQTDFDSAQIMAMRGWWPFLFACIAFYGLLPRLILWVVFYGWYRRQLVRAFVNFPGARMVLDRMDAPLVHTQGDSREKAVDRVSEAVSMQALPGNRNRILISWSGAASQEALKRLGMPDETVESAGLELSEDRQLLQQINNLRKDVVVMVKSWEPPLSELGDFLHDISPTVDCYLLLLPLPDREVKAEERADWQQFARQKHHPRLMVVVGGRDAREPAQ